MFGANIGVSAPRGETSRVLRIHWSWTVRDVETGQLGGETSTGLHSRWAVGFLPVVCFNRVLRSPGIDMLSVGLVFVNALWDVRNRRYELRNFF